MAHTRVQVVRVRRQFLGRKTSDYRKRGLVGRLKARPSRVRGVRKKVRPVRERAAGALGAEEGLQEGGVTGRCLLGVLKEAGGAVLGSRGRPCTHNAGKVGVFRVRHGGGEAGLGDWSLGGAGAGVRVGERLGPGPGIRRRQRERRRRWRSRKSRDSSSTGEG